MRWPEGAAKRKSQLFDERAISIALKRLNDLPVLVAA
jgi:hypothetical protein